MATFLDVSIIQSFSGIFTFILVFVLAYGLMEMLKALGDDKKSLHAIIAMILAFMVSMSKGVTVALQVFTPWITMLILVIFFIIFTLKMFGVKNEDIYESYKKKNAILTWIIILTVVIVLFSIGAGFGQEALEQGQKGGITTSVETGEATAPTDTGSFSQNLYNTIFHPKVLGLLLVMFIVIVAMLFLTDADKI
jgi:CDP-diglyceride synthetase